MESNDYNKDQHDNCIAQLMEAKILLDKIGDMLSAHANSDTYSEFNNTISNIENMSSEISALIEP